MILSKCGVGGTFVSTLYGLSMMALMKTLDLFGREIAVVTRERMRKQYSSFEYLLSKALAELPIDAFFSVVFAGVLKMTTGLRCSMPVLTGTYALMTVAGELSCFLENHVVACILQTVMPPFGCSMFNYLQMLGYETILFLLLLS